MPQNLFITSAAQGDLLGELPSKTVSEEHARIYSPSAFSRRNVDCYHSITAEKTNLIAVIILIISLFILYSTNRVL